MPGVLVRVVVPGGGHPGLELAELVRCTDEDEVDRPDAPAQLPHRHSPKRLNLRLNLIPQILLLSRRR